MLPTKRPTKMLSLVLEPAAVQVLILKSVLCPWWRTAHTCCLEVTWTVTGPEKSRWQNRFFRLCVKACSVCQAIRNFDNVLAMVKPPAPPVTTAVVAPPPEPKPSAPPAPPAIVVASPSGAGANQTIESNESTLVIRGVAMDSTGIPVVSINGTGVNMRPQTPKLPSSGLTRCRSSRGTTPSRLPPPTRQTWRPKLPLRSITRPKQRP